MPAADGFEPPATGFFLFQRWFYGSFDIVKCKLICYY